jgi:hypothetical protein
VTTVHIAHALPWPGARPDGGFLVSQHLVVLTEAAAEDSYPSATRRGLALWLQVPGGNALWQLLNRPSKDPVMAGVLEETAARLLYAAGVTVTAVDLRVTSLDAVELRSVDVRARVELGITGGARHVTVGAGYGLALAAASGAPVRVADAVLDRLGVWVQDDDLVTPFLPSSIARTQGRLPQRWRFEPRNLTFADGLDRWELFGDAEGEHRQDYSCAAGSRSVTLACAVNEPHGSAVLVQAIFADDYRDHTVTFRGELRPHDVAGHAALYLAASRLSEPPRGHLCSRGARSLPAAGSSDWTRYEVTMQVPGDADRVWFGLLLSGHGSVGLRNAELTSGA